MASLVVFFFVNMANASEKPLILSYCVKQCKTEAQLQHTIRLSHGHEADILLVDPETNTTHHLRTIKQSEESHALTLKAEYQKSFDGVLSQQLTNRLALYLNRFETMLNENGSDLNKSKYGYPIYSLHDFLTAEESAHFRIQDNYFTKTESIYTNELNDRYASLIEQQDAEFNRLLVDEFGERPMAIDPLLQLYVINELTVILVEKPGDPFGIKATLRTNGKHIIVDFETLVLMNQDYKPELEMSISNWVHKEKHHNRSFISGAPERYEPFLRKFGFSILNEDGSCNPCKLIYEQDIN
jgi:hypothetical protein